MSNSSGKINIIYRKEMAEFFYSPIAYVFMILFLVVSMYLFLIYGGGIFTVESATMREFFMILPLVFIIFIPGLTMGSFSNEKNNGTIELLFTYPLTDWVVVLGKFFAVLTIICITLLGTLVVPVYTHIRLGNFDIGQLLTQYLGAILLSCSYISIGMFISSLTKELIMSFLITFVILLFLAFVGFNQNSIQFPEWLGFLKIVFIWISTSTHFTSFGKGVIDSRDVIYYLGLTILFFYLTKRSIENRKWS